MRGLSNLHLFLLEDMVYKIQQNNMWNEVRELYLYKKNINTDSHKKSRSLYAETVKEIYDFNRIASVSFWSTGPEVM